MQSVWLLIAAWLAAVNVGAFAMFAVDKRRAQTGGRRIPEARLLEVTALGGGIGGFLAQQAFRHKTRKQPFQNRFRLLLVLQTTVLLFLIAGGDRLLIRA